MTHAFYFLFRGYNVVPFYNIDWYTDFKNLVFPPSLAIAPADTIAAGPTAVPDDDIVLDAAIDVSLATTHD